MSNVAGELHLVAVDLGVPEALRPESPSMHHRATTEDWIETDAVTSIGDGVARLLSSHAAFARYLEHRNVEGQDGRTDPTV